MMNDGSHTNAPVPMPYSCTAATALAWLGADAPRIAATHAAAPLADLIEVVLAALTDARKEFTAYDVTMLLRALFPYQRPLPHYDRAAAPGVQPEVHSQMDVYLANGSYTVRTVYPNGADPARLYTPAKQPRGGWQLLRRASGLGAVQPGSSTLPRGAWVVRNHKAH